MCCEHQDSCTFIQHMSKIVPFTLHMTKIKYCEHDKYSCARYGLLQVMEMKHLPVDMWPGDQLKAQEILATALK